MTRRLLEVGCGAGEHTNYLQIRNPQAEVYGLDISPENIKKCEASKVSCKTTFKISQAEKIPFDDGFFDEVYCFEVLEHVSDFNQSLGEIKRVLKPNGKLSLSVPLEESELMLASFYPDYFNDIGHQRTFTKEKLIKGLTDNGFDIDKYQQWNAIDHIVLSHTFRRGTRIVNQIGGTATPGPVMPWVLCLFLSKHLFLIKFTTKGLLYKIGMLLGAPLWICGRILDLFALNKGQHVICHPRQTAK